MYYCDMQLNKDLYNNTYKLNVQGDHISYIEIFP